MPIAYPDILDLKIEPRRFSWSDRDAMLYALAIGMGADPLDNRELPFVYENGLKAVPTLASAVAFSVAPMVQARVNLMMVVHGEQSIVFHRPFPSEGEMTAASRFVAAYDKGAAKGAVLTLQTELTGSDGQPLATMTSTAMARGDGGFGGPAHGAPDPHQVPEREPDQVLHLPTRLDQALLYRLCGDRNPLHADPGFARAVGFPRPILHGLCAYGMACRAVLQGCAEYDPARILSHGARFSSPVFPGEVLSISLWRDGDVVSFEGRVEARDAVVLKGGRTELR